MSFRRVKTVLMVCCGAGALLTATLDANAGGFAVREQSVYGQGTSFSGIAAGGALSSMFWNPSTMTQFDGKGFEMGVSAIIPKVAQSGSATKFPAPGATFLGFTGGVDNSGLSAMVPSSYSSWQLTDQLWLGMATTSPFGLAVGFPQVWAGAPYAQNTDQKSFNFNPTVAYKINNWISVGAGFQAQYMKITFGNLASAGFFSGSNLLLVADGWGYGWTAGVTLTPLPATQIGIGYRSAIDQNLAGSMTVPAAAPAGSTPGSFNATAALPGTLSVGLRQGIGDRFTLLAGFEWTNWSRIGTTNVFQPNGAPLLGPGAAAVKFPFEYQDGYLYSLGGEYMVTSDLTVRAGLAYEKSPITDLVRTPRIPDNDRMWYSLGASYKPPQFRGLTFDFAYSFVQAKATHIDVSQAAGNPWANALFSYAGDASSHVNIISLAAVYRWDDRAPMPNKKLYTK